MNENYNDENYGEVDCENNDEILNLKPTRSKSRETNSMKDIS